MFTSDFHAFLRELSQNNHKEWFHDNKKRYESSVKKPFFQFIEQLLEKLKLQDASIQNTASDAIFRINKDVRFSKDKSPYKTHMAASLTCRTRKAEDAPGYYIHLELGQVMLGGGAYFVSKDGLEQLRNYMAEKPTELDKIIKNSDFVAKYGEVQGERNARLPKTLEAAAKQQPLIFNKHLYYMATLPPDAIYAPNFTEQVLDYFRAGQPLNDYLRTAFNK